MLLPAGNNSSHQRMARARVVLAFPCASRGRGEFAGKQEPMGTKQRSARSIQADDVDKRKSRLYLLDKADISHSSHGEMAEIVPAQGACRRIGRPRAGNVRR